MVHTCPFFNATKGELATYCLQKITNTNWYDLDSDYYKFVDGTLESSVDYYSLQEVLQELLNNDNELNKIERLWRTKINEP